MLEGTCSACTPPKAKRPNPRHRDSQTLHGTLAVDTEGAQHHKYIVVQTQKSREHSSFTNINETTTRVHIAGHPFLWALEKILDQGLNLQFIRILPSKQGQVGPLHKKLCQNREVQLITGYHRPESTWNTNGARSLVYQTQRTFLLNLQGKQKALFEELLTFEFKIASITSRYFCLQGEEYLSQRNLCVEYGYKETTHHSISQRINALFYYLDPEFDPGNGAKEMAEAVKARLPRLRARFHSDVMQKKLVKQFRLKHNAALASNIPPIRLETFGELLKARADGRFDALQAKNPKNGEVLTLRFGLDTTSTGVGVYRTLKEIGEIMGVTRERIRQRERDALEFLGITSFGASAKKSSGDNL